MSIESRLDRLENSQACGCHHLVVVNDDGDTDAARCRYESSGRKIQPGDKVTFVQTGIPRAPGDPPVPRS